MHVPLAVDYLDTVGGKDPSSTQLSMHHIFQIRVIGLAWQLFLYMLLRKFFSGKQQTILFKVVRSQMEQECSHFTKWLSRYLR